MCQNPLIMKTISAILLLFALLSFRPFSEGNARTQKIQGVEVFIYSEPVRDYEVIESGKVIATLTGSCSEQVNQSVKKAAKAKADAVIIYLESSKWDAIKYK